MELISVYTSPSHECHIQGLLHGLSPPGWSSRNNVTPKRKKGNHSFKDLLAAEILREAMARYCKTPTP